MNMRDLFPGYYQPTEEDFSELWKECIFSFDTNVLLHIYRYSPKTRERLFDILKELQKRIWIPHQVAYEIHKNRLTVISDQSGAYKEIQNILDNNLAIGTLKEQLFKNFKRHPFLDVKQIIEDIEVVIKKVKDDLEAATQEHPDFLENDELWDQLITIIDGKVGQPFSKEELDKKYKVAEQRFKDSIPPGYKDDKGKNANNKYGDVILWFQLIEYAKSEKKPIIFVTDDDKEDWWLKHSRKTISPRPELVQEMLTEAGVRFYMYPADKFLDYAQKFLNLSEKPEVIEEARDIRVREKYIDYSSAVRNSLINSEAIANIAKLQNGLMDSKIIEAIANATKLHNSKMAEVIANATKLHNSKMAEVIAKLQNGLENSTKNMIQ
ncbi:PIN domain-containing protein [Anabaena sp. UHCC 0451]|uniref:PIN domain-containing protein n=1 Tax=Anabaena sp. UHCC 0451 TaxID=2055235 RepID=UPI002B21B33F|nr:PIN domain-containing protein [Anabaena sp. UHCC 0451]MEA5576168.1 PIN domain-containing protein [Anabaena sp. UHCC 0451]